MPKLVERRKSIRCGIDRKTQLYIRYWPGLMAVSFGLVGFFPANAFGNNIDVAYNYATIVVAMAGVLAVVFWKTHFTRNIMASIALARSFAVVVAALFHDPPIPFPVIMRLTAGGVLSLMIFFLAVVEIPYLKVMAGHGR